MRPYDDRDLVAEIAYTEYVTQHSGYRVYEIGWDDGDIEYQFFPVKTVAKNVLPDPILSNGIYDQRMEEDALHDKIDIYIEDWKLETQ